MMKIYNRETMLVLPLTTKQKEDRFHCKIKFSQWVVWVKLTQVRVISNKRLLRKMGVLDQPSFDELKKEWVDSL